ncbi:hypothetical protein NPIL_374511 [Nephila pilipes]|uniref:Uncharacterized protein n=1 Tax=Nephila pilipes TaxID=299642 RepID=A0A8X6N3W7_NEPPI|nr:hypothetical protein NPIL_374511 [Nephila pilipes]
MGFKTHPTPSGHVPKTHFFSLLPSKCSHLYFPSRGKDSSALKIHIMCRNIPLASPSSPFHPSIHRLRFTPDEISVELDLEKAFHMIRVLFFFRCLSLGERWQAED